ncbi:MAG: flagellar hook protein FlgE [Lachnospiraceae bacterium]
MMRSMYSGVAGLKTHQTRMDVIGNNIANVNTVGYKSQSVQFAELLYQTTSNASGPNATAGTGGVNAKQIGLGVKTGAISTAITRAGSAETTNNPFDLCITGDSFFVVNNGLDNFFTRDGSFNVDAAGNLVLSSTGYNVMGWQVDENGDIKQDTVSALRIMSAANMTYPPESTTLAYVSGIIDKNSTDFTNADGKIMNLNFYDKRGYSYTAKLAIKATGTEGQYSCEVVKVLDAKGNEVEGLTAKLGGNNLIPFTSGDKTINLTDDLKYNEADATIEVDGTTYKIVENENGITFTQADGTAIDDQDAIWEKIAKSKGVTDIDEFKNYGTTIEIDGKQTIQTLGKNLLTLLKDAKANSADNNTLTLTGKLSESVILRYSPATGEFQGIGTGSDTTSTGILQLGGTGMENFNDITIDFSASSNVNNEGTSTVSATSGDKDGYGAGRKLGDMTGVSIQNNGMIYATYDNGQSKLLGQIAVASFANASGLAKEGDNLYSATQNSGQFDGIGIDITADGGYMTTGELEMSNVDLSAELTGMIVTQRGFQANSRIITVSDSMLEELVNLKRS